MPERPISVHRRHGGAPHCLFAAGRADCIRRSRTRRVTAHQHPEAPRLEAAVIEPVWVVRALGTFGTFRGPEPGPQLAGSGFFVFSDADGSIIAFGFP